MACFPSGDQYKRLKYKVLEQHGYLPCVECAKKSLTVPVLSEQASYHVWVDGIGSVLPFATCIQIYIHKEYNIIL